ncbi:Inactive hydroxysteroid dehydrogenase-like protein 1 [Acropora cervicornis]|uniref:Inactive hydroxysteroid dehydrogenase-like protein 1 n=1 Tax=Acropora cervicornis TaxID=6130 RepID=A0AAD9QW28_ACRCE|nr:Inactive hydroxysteroid dehydrogenase-like protein 1 [Acropora cervicornis]
MEWNLLSYAGAAFLGYYSFTFLLQVIHGVRAFVLPTIGIKKNLKKLGEWAAVTYGTETKVISMDFSGGVEIYDVNNVGVSHYPEFFTHMKREDAWKMINVNILSVIMMTHIILPEMAANVCYLTM